MASIGETIGKAELKGRDGQPKAKAKAKKARKKTKKMGRPKVKDMSLELHVKENVLIASVEDALSIEVVSLDINKSGELTITLDSHDVNNILKQLIESETGAELFSLEGTKISKKGKMFRIEIN